MDKFKDAIEEDDSESYPELKQDLRYALETGDAKNNPVYDQLKKVDDATKIFGQQKYSSGDVKSYLKDTSVMINQLDKLFKMSITEPMTQQDTVRQVRNDAVQRFAQASEKMIDGLRSVAKGVKSIDQVKILANLENELKDLQPEEGIHQNYALPKRVKDGIFLIKDYMRMYKRVESGSPDESDRRQLRDPLFGTVVTPGVKKKNIKITKDYFKEENLQELSKAEKEKRLQRAKDMIKYYDAQKKAALKGPNKALAKKMLKNETELEEMKKDDAYAIGMAQAKKSMNDEPPLDKKTITKGHEIAKKILNKEEVAIVYTDKKTRQVVSKKFKNDAEARKWIKQFDGAAGQINFKPSSMLKNDVNEVSDKLKLKVLQKKIKQYKDKVFKKTMSTVKSPLFAGVEEALEIKEFTSQMIDRLKKSFSTAPKKISPEQANALSRHLDRIELNDLRKLVKANIPFVSTVARNKIYKKTGKFENNVNEDRRLYVEAIAGLQKKADKSGMPYSILKKVYDRGMAAWKSGHRPGASQQQWAFARVNSFVTKSSGTWGGADKDLAKQVKGK